MRSRNRRGGSLLAFAAAAVVLALAAPALACTAYVGKVTISAADGTGGTTYEGNGQDNPEHGYCSTPGRAGLAGPVPAFRLEVERVSSCQSFALYSGVYEVRWRRAAQSDGSPADPQDNAFICNGFTPDAGKQWVTLGVMRVQNNPSGPDGSGTYPLPSPGPGNICLQAVPGTVPNEGYSTPQVPMSWTVI